MTHKCETDHRITAVTKGEREIIERKESLSRGRGEQKAGSGSEKTKATGRKALCRKQPVWELI